MRLFLACVVLSAAAQAATINTTFTITNATLTLGLSTTLTGPISLTNIGNGTISATISSDSSGNFTGPYTITLSGGDTIKGNISLPPTVLSGGSGGSVTVTGGTGQFANATGSFSNISGTANQSGTNFTLNLTGTGTITTGGSGGGGGGGAAPSITQVLNNYSYTPPGFSNSGIAQGSLFIIKGSNLADPNAQAVLQSSANGLPTTLNGASVKVTVNGTTVTPVFYYAIASQLALVLPSNTPTGTGTVTVTFNGQSGSAPIQVVSSAMGFDAYNGTGAGLAVATNNSTGALYNYTNSIAPGTPVVLWGSGLGADAARDTTFVGAAFSINSLAHVYVGGIEAQILYQGASGYPGVNQVDITIPGNAPTGCNISLVGVRADGAPTNFLTLPIGNGTCSDPLLGISGSAYQTLTGQSTVKEGFVSLSHSVSPAQSGSGTQTNDGAFASFEKVTSSAFDSGSGGLSIPGCTVTEFIGTGGTSTSVGLDAGTITVTGPNGSATLTAFPQQKGVSFAQLPAGFIPNSGGAFSFHGGGGADVGPFDTSITFPNPLLTWTNKSSDSTVTRASGVLFTWSGGSPGTLVYMTGDSSGTVNGQQVSASFTCISPQEALQFQVPSYVTSVMPAGSGSLSISNYTNFTTFSPAGLDIAFALGFSSEMANATYQ